VIHRIFLQEKGWALFFMAADPGDRLNKQYQHKHKERINAADNAGKSAISIP